MKTTLFLTTLLLSQTSLAAPIRCERVIGDGVEQKNTVVVVDPEKGLLTIESATGNFQQAVLTDSAVSPYDAPALWWDRKDECSTDTARLPSGALGYNFSCKSSQDVNLNGNLEIAADRKSASYTGAIQVKDQSDQRFSGIFIDCH
jgi:hypothetical protein